MLKYYDEILKIKKNKTGAIISLHKPLLLLLVLSKIKQGHKNNFLYDDIEPFLELLLSKYGLKNTKKINPQYPFVYLGSSPEIWECTIKRNELKIPDAASRKELIGQIGKLNSAFYAYLKSDNKKVDGIILFLLNEYWPEAYHEDILNDLGVSLKPEKPLKNERSTSFVEEVLNAYERKCAICGQSIRLGDSLIGIDACHLKPIQHYGDDNIHNGLALCKLHHWSLDRGAITIDSNLQVKVSPKINGSMTDVYLTNYDGCKIFLPRNQEKWLSKENITYHSSYIFSG